MLWPEGSCATVADIGSYLEPQLENERIQSYVVSKSGAFMAVCSKRVLALFRLKPLAPLMIHPALFPDTEMLELISSGRGEYLACRTKDNRISVFSVQPHHDIEEVLRMTSIVTPGLGEAIGAREIWLKPLHSIRPEYEVLGLDQIGGMLALYSEGTVHLADWKSFESTDPLNPPAFTPYKLNSKLDRLSITSSSVGSYGRQQWLTSCISYNRILVSVWKGALSNDVEKLEEVELSVEGTPVCLDYNARLCKLAVATKEGRVIVFPNPLDTDSAYELPNRSSKYPITLQWSAAGTVLFVGYTDGWQLLSMLGLVLFSMHSRTRDHESPLGFSRCEWMISGEAAVMLGTDGKLRIQNMLRWSGFGGSDSRPVLHGNGRLLLYHDTKMQTGSSNKNTSISGAYSWLTVPLPTWYMAQNWPVAHVCSSSDGRYVAVAGKIGIMLFSVLTKQWKEIGDRDSMVRGGLCWHGRRLVAASVNADNDITSLKMYSAVGGAHGSSSQSVSGSQFLWGGSPQNTGKHKRSPSNHRNSFYATGGSNPGSSNALNTIPTLTSSNGASGSSNHNRRLSAQDLLSVPSGNAPGSATHSHGHNSQGGGGVTSPLIGSSLPSSVSVANLNTSEQQVIAEDILGRGASSSVNHIFMGPNDLLGVVAGDSSKQLLIYDLSNNDFDLIRDIPLTSVLSSHFAPDPVIRSLAFIDEWQVLVLVKMTLILVTSVDDEARQYQLRVIADPIESFEYLHYVHQLWVFDGQEAVMTDWTPSPTDDDSGKDSKRFVASVPFDAYPIHFSSNRGVASLIESEPVRSYDGKFSVARPSFSQEVYIQYLLEAALVPAYQTAVDIAKKYQRTQYFAGILESLLYRTVVSDDTQGDDTKKAVILIREFPSQNSLAIFASCARKVDMKYWTKLFKAVGATPAELFDKSLADGDMETANEYLIVVQTSSDETGATDDSLDLKGRILSLYNAAVKYNQIWICKQVCQFIMAVDPSGASLREFRGYLNN